jgi:CRP-like cAMP-binding protein
MKVIQWKLYWPLLNLTQKSTFLSKTGIFPNWAEDQLLQFSLLFHEQCYPRGSIIVEESQISKQVIVVLRGELAVYTKQNTYKDKRHFASLKTTRRPTSAIRRAALHQSNHEKRGTKSNVNKFRGKKFREDHKTYGLQIATLEKGTIIGLGVSVQEPEPFTIIAKHDTAALVLSSQIVKNLILGGSTTNAAVKVRHRNCLAAMTAMFENQQRITNTLSLELKSQLKRSADVISKAVNFRKKMPKLKRRNEFTTSVTKKQTRPSTAGPIRLRPVETYTKKKNPTKTLKKSLNLLNKYDSLAAARFGKLDALCTRYKTTTEYWATVDNRKKKARRPFSATTRRNISMLSTIEYAKIRATRISDAILGARSPLNLKSARHMSLEH